jgi:hypothetical protein
MGGQALLRPVDGPLGEWQCLIDTPGPSPIGRPRARRLERQLSYFSVAWADKL